MCGYSTTWNPVEYVLSPLTASAPILAFPSFAFAGDFTVKRTVDSSSSRANVTDALAGSTVQPAGTFRCTMAVAADGVSLRTVTRTSRVADPPVGATTTS